MNTVKEIESNSSVDLYLGVVVCNNVNKCEWSKTSNKTGQWHKEVMIQGRPIKSKIDIGAEINVISFLVPTEKSGIIINHNEYV